MEHAEHVLNRDLRPGWWGVAGLAVLGGAATFTLGVAGEYACMPPALPGEGGYALSLAVDATVDRLAGATTGTACFTTSSGGRLAIGAAELLAAALPALLLLALFLQLGGERLQRWLVALRGGHLVALLDAVDSGDALRGAAAPLRLLAPAAGSADGDARELDAAGLARASSVLLASGDDALNIRLARACLRRADQDRSAGPPLAVRIEDGLVADSVGADLRSHASRVGCALTIFAATRNRVRRGVAFATPARVRAVPDAPFHAVVCGAGPLLREIGGTIVRRGYGLGDATPRLTVLAVATADGAVPDLAHLEQASLGEVAIRRLDGIDVLGIDREITHLLLEQPPVRAVHLCSTRAGRVEALAERWRRRAEQLGVPCPRLLLYDDGCTAGPPRPGAHCEAIVVPRVPMLDAEEVARRMDLRARTLHETYIAGARERLGDAFGARPAEREWDELSTQFREENQESADGLEHLLESADLALRDPEPGDDSTRTFEAEVDEIEAMGRIEHARWMASRYYLGWRHAEVRDDARLLHPDIVPYDDLSEPTRDKDRDNARNAVRLVQSEGRRIVRRGPARASAADDVRWPTLAISDASPESVARMHEAARQGQGIDWASTGAPLPDPTDLPDDLRLSARLWLVAGGADGLARWTADREQGAHHDPS